MRGGVKLRWKELNGMMTDDSRSDPVSDGSTLAAKPQLRVKTQE